MNYCNPPKLGHNEQLLARLLADLQRRFYGTLPTAVFQRDRRRLLYALSWPASWLERRGLDCTPSRYQAIVIARLDAIRAKGDPERYGAYFPNYLLKCLQDSFEHQGDALYEELKHVRNALEGLWSSLRFSENMARQNRQIENLAAIHRLLRNQSPPVIDPHQMTLF
jgi:hypothetical protein